MKTNKQKFTYGTNNTLCCLGPMHLWQPVAFVDVGVGVGVAMVVVDVAVVVVRRDRGGSINGGGALAMVPKPISRG
jgi:hypothetical protein